MNQAARHIGRALALLLPVVLVLSGTLAVARVPWATTPSESQVLSASAEKASTGAGYRSAQHALTSRLLQELHATNPGVALTSLQREVAQRPALARYCTQIARALGRAAVSAYGAFRAQSYSRPVCDNSFAAGVAQRR